MSRLAAGTLAPDFTLLTDAGTPLTLSSLRGKPVVLFFYPKDDTSGCTIEACEFRDDFPRFGESHAVILGISPDSVRSHVKFKKKFQLPYALLADTKHTVSEAYDVWKEKQLYSVRYMGVERTTFVIDARGMVARVFDLVQPEGHAAEVMAVVAAL